MGSALRVLALLLGLLPLAAGAQGAAAPAASVPAPVQTEPPASSTPAPAPADSAQAENAALQSQLGEATRERDDARQQLAVEQGRTPHWMARLPPRVAGALPAGALLVSLLTLLLAALTAWKAWKDRVALSAEYREVHARLKTAQVEFSRRQTAEAQVPAREALPKPVTAPATERPAGPPAAPGRKKSQSVTPPETPPETVARAAGQPPSPPEEKPVPSPAEPAAIGGEVPVPQEDISHMTGDPAADYARAQADPERGTARLREQYGTLWGLSCTNLEQSRRAEGTLRFAESPRPTFLAFVAGGDTLLIPAPDRDPLAMRQSLEGVFVFPESARAPLALARPATVREAGGEWLLVSPGEFRLG